jgi:hypothetical protein
MNSIDHKQVSNLLLLFYCFTLKVAPVATFKTLTLKVATGATFRVCINSKHELIKHCRII